MNGSLGDLIGPTCLDFIKSWGGDCPVPDELLANTLNIQQDLCPNLRLILALFLGFLGGCSVPQKALS